MPIYEYRCEACGQTEEKLQSISAPERHACPGCGAPEGMARQLSRTAFALAGNGWASQGYSEKAAEAKPAPKPVGGGCCGGGCACH